MFQQPRQTDLQTNGDSARCETAKLRAAASGPEKSMLVYHILISSSTLRLKHGYGAFGTCHSRTYFPLQPCPYLYLYWHKEEPQQFSSQPSTSPLPSTMAICLPLPPATNGQGGHTLLQFTKRATRGCQAWVLVYVRAWETCRPWHVQ